VWQGTIDGHAIAMQVRPMPNGIRLAHQGFEGRGQRVHGRRSCCRAADAGRREGRYRKKLLCPMPGLVVSIAVSEGQEVKAGETLAVVEAMKMQNVLARRARRHGQENSRHSRRDAGGDA